MMQKTVGDFLDMLAAEKGASNNTLEAYYFDLQQLSDYFEKDLTEITSQDMQEFIAYLGNGIYEAISVARKISAFNDFFKFLLSEKKISQNPMLLINPPKKKKALPKFLTRDEVDLLIDAADASSDLRHKRLATMLRLMYACGLRVSELVKLPLNCINFNRKQILVKGKGSKERIVPIADEALKNIFEWLPLREKMLKGQKKPFLFPSTSAEEGHIDRSTFFKNIKEIAKNTPIEPNRVSPHVLRHSFATHLLHENINLRSVQKLLGHEDISTTEIYTHILPTELLEAVLEKHPLAQRKS